MSNYDHTVFNTNSETLEIEAHSGPSLNLSVKIWSYVVDIWP